MSGIVGIYRLNGAPVGRAELEGMTESIAHRGPDGHGVWHSSFVGLGHRMLRTTPESLEEKIPLANGSEDLAITADARIDNREELMADVGLSGHPDGEVADSVLILAAYRKWGEGCVEHLLGDFAFAVWDGRKQSLFCARDHFGVKPFNYYSSATIFAFGSEIKTLLCLPEIPRRLDEIRVGDYLASMYEDKARTFYQDIHRLPPGHSLTASRRGMNVRQYWSPDPSRELRLGSDEEYAEAFREIFTEAVRCRLRSAYSVGSLLSGGLDSSAVTCVARDLLAQDGQRSLATFSAVFDEVHQSDERLFINAVLRQNGVTPRFVHGDRLSPLADLDRVLWHQDEPLGAFNLFLNWALYSATQQQDVRVLLDGFDGDTTVSHGIGYLPELARARRWLTLAKEVRGLARNFNHPTWGPLRAYAWHYGLKPLVPKPIRMARSLLRGKLRRGDQSKQRPGLRAYLNPRFEQRVGLIERSKADRRAPAQTEREVHHRNLTQGVMPYILEALDRAGAAFHIEPRYPFWDKRLVEFCLALPGEQKIRHGWTRMVMRRALGGTLPPEVQWRGGKSNLGYNFDRSLLAFEQSRMEEVIVRDPTSIEEYVDVNALREAHRRFVSQRLSNEGDVHAIWNAVTLSLWLQRTKLGVR